MIPPFFSLPIHIRDVRLGLKQLGLLPRQTAGGPFHADAEPAVLRHVDVHIGN